MRCHAARAGIARRRARSGARGAARTVARDRLCGGARGGPVGFAGDAGGGAGAGYHPPDAWHRPAGRRRNRARRPRALPGRRRTMKRVFLFRHAKTEQVNKDTPADAARALTERGRKDSPRVGRAMREKGYQPDLILCSTSTRTRQTWEFANAELHSTAKVEFVEELYAAD